MMMFKSLEVMSLALTKTSVRINKLVFGSEGVIETDPSFVQTRTQSFTEEIYDNVGSISEWVDDGTVVAIGDYVTYGVETVNTDGEIQNTNRNKIFRATSAGTWSSLGTPITGSDWAQVYLYEMKFPDDYQLDITNASEWESIPNIGSFASLFKVVNTTELDGGSNVIGATTTITAFLSKVAGNGDDKISYNEVSVYYSYWNGSIWVNDILSIDRVNATTKTIENEIQINIELNF